MSGAESSDTGELPDFSDIPDTLGASAAAKHDALPRPLPRAVAAPTRQGLARRRRVALLVSAAWALLQLAALGVRGDLARLPLDYLVTTVALPLALGVACLIIALQPGTFGLGARRSIALLLLLVTPASVLAGALLLPAPYEGGISGNLTAIFMCGNIALAWAALPLLCAALTLDRSFAANAGLRSALVGSAAGVGAAVAAQVRCPVTGGLHIAFAHGGALVIATVIGGLLLRKVTRA